MLAAAPARAEVIQLLDNTQVSGKILHFYDGVFAIETSGGQKVDIPTAKIKAITFKLPPPRAEFSTPEKTFQRYKDALVKNDITKLIDCYALMYQGMMAAEARPRRRRAGKKMQRKSRAPSSRSSRRRSRATAPRSRCSAPRATTSKPPRSAWCSRTANGS